MPIALVTGGTSGIGAAFASALARRGFDLIIVARNPDRLAESAKRIAEVTGRKVQIEVADLGVRSETDRIADLLRTRDEPIDVLVNNAGHGLRTKLADPDVAEHDAAIEVMIRALYVLAAAAVPGMRERGSGSIINVASVAGLLPMGQYAAIKSWAAVFSESLANELHGTGVTVTALMPGWVHTEFHDRADIRKSSIPESLWLDPHDLVEHCLHDVDAGRVMSIPSARYKVIAALVRLLPRSVVRRIARTINRSRSEARV
ncbi:SDR family NAD(P)-dependent oxidoreductase [Agromyces seonyuensis]|uniref:SDR family NAD(P)-dependent oxidoreductase n=1 Tax=Agromyces seonyuensis TaxID=2662446 RepID=A0A6I4P531_9MICO|nr:SDR family NAD(P)-dependent oxidoreductase [Agromyces seonyuensis]MWB98494.1 SDR family NAD(P)-dependent oxidoreductase [Agromyces seonyuensis]